MKRRSANRDWCSSGGRRSGHRDPLERAGGRLPACLTFTGASRAAGVSVDSFRNPDVNVLAMSGIVRAHSLVSVLYGEGFVDGHHTAIGAERVHIGGRDG